MNLKPIAQAITVAFLALASAWCFQSFADIFVLTDGWSCFAALIPGGFGLLFFGLVYQLTMNSAERQLGRGQKPMTGRPEL